MPNDFVSTLANIYAQARPQFQVQQSKPAILPFAAGTTRNDGWGGVGKSLGEGFSEGFTKTYVEPQQELYKQKLMWDNDPKIIAQRAEIMAEKYWMMTPEQQKTIRENKEWATFWTKANGIGIPTSSAVDPETGKEYHVPAGGPTKAQQEAVGVQGMDVKPWEAPVRLSEAETGLRKSQTKEVDVDTLTKDLALQNARKISAANFPFLSAAADLKIKEAEPALKEAQTGAALSESALRGTQTRLAPIHAERELEAIKSGNLKVEVELQRLRNMEAKTQQEEKKKEDTIRSLYFKDWNNRDIDVDKANRGVAGQPRDPKLETVILTQKAGNLKGLINGLTQDLGEAEAVTHPRTVEATTRTVDQAYNLLSKAAATGTGHKVIGDAETEALVGTVEEIVRSMSIVKEGEKGPAWHTDLPPSALAKLAWMQEYLKVVTRAQTGRGYLWDSSVKLPSLDTYLKAVTATPRITNKGGKK
jgi:hypothetical protein